MARREGKTTALVAEAAAEVRAGRDVAFVVCHPRQADYVLRMAADLERPEFVRPHRREVQFGHHVLRVVTVQTDFGGMTGWPGAVRFDHDALEPLRDRPAECWREMAARCNARYEPRDQRAGA